MLHKGKCISKTRCLIAIFLTFFLISSFLCLDVNAADPPANSYNMDAWDAYAKETLDSPIKYFVYSILKWGVYGVNHVVEVYDSFLFNWSPTGDIAAIVEGLTDAISQIGMTLCFLYFLLELLEHATRDSFTAEHLVKSFAKLIIMFIIFDPRNIDTLAGFGIALRDLIKDGVNRGIDNAAYLQLEQLIAEIKSESWLKAIFMALDFNQIIAMLGSLLPMVAILFVGFGRNIEVSVYRAMLPLGMASIYSGGMHSSGVRYFKKFLALEIQGAILYALIVLSHHFYTDALVTFNGGGLALVMMFAYSIAVVAIVVKSRSIANDVIGV